MTMQIAIRANNGIVLASDTKTRTSESEASRTALVVTGESKIRLCENHRIAIAFSGKTFGSDADAASDLKSHLDSVAELGELKSLLETWANAYFKTQFPSDNADPIIGFTAFRLLVANAESQYDPFCVLDVAKQSQASSTHGYYVVTGDRRNSAIFWPSYFECDARRRDLKAVINIAATTILAGHEFNKDGVSGLEVYFCANDGEWQAMPPDRIERLEAHYGMLHTSMQSLLAWD